MNTAHGMETEDNLNLTASTELVAMNFTALSTSFRLYEQREELALGVDG